MTALTFLAVAVALTPAVAAVSAVAAVLWCEFVYLPRIAGED